MSMSLKPRIWLQYKLDLPVYSKQKIFLSYHVQFISELLVLKTCASHRFNVNLPVNLCGAHLEKPKYSEIPC